MPPDVAFRFDWFVVMCSAMPDNKPDPGLKADPGGESASGGRGLIRRVRRLLIIIAGTYVAVCVAVFFFQSHLIYFPTEDYRLTPDDVGLAFADLSLASIFCRLVFTG